MALRQVVFADGTPGCVDDAWLKRWPEDIRSADGTPVTQQPQTEDQREALTPTTRAVKKPNRKQTESEQQHGA